jgi:hypothetical protein
MTLTIKDLAVDKELSQEERAAVRGGSLFFIPTGQVAGTSGAFSPVNQISTPVAVDASTHLNLNVTTQTTQAIDSLVAQLKG